MSFLVGLPDVAELSLEASINESGKFIMISVIDLSFPNQLNTVIDIPKDGHIGTDIMNYSILVINQ